MNLGQRLRMYRKQHGYSQQQLAEHLNYKSFTTIQKWETDDAAPPIQALEKLAKLYRCNINDFFVKSPIKKKVPILGTVIGGEPIDAIQDYLGEYEVELDDDDNRYFYLRVVGDSMIDARIHPGDDVFVRRQSMVDNGDIAIVLIDQEATLKRVFFENNILILKPENSKYEPIMIDISELEQDKVQILGKVLHNRINIR